MWTYIYEWMNEQAHYWPWWHILQKRNVIFLPLGSNTPPCLSIKPLQFSPNSLLYGQFLVLQKSSAPSTGLTSQLNSTLSTRSLFCSQHPAHSLGTPNISCPCCQLKSFATTYHIFSTCKRMAWDLRLILITEWFKMSFNVIIVQKCWYNSCVAS